MICTKNSNTSGGGERTGSSKEKSRRADRRSGAPCAECVATRRRRRQTDKLKEPDEKELQREDREEKAYVTAVMIMAILMMGLTAMAMAGVWVSMSAAVMTTGFVAIKGRGRRNKTARMMMMMVLTAAAVWVTVGSVGGDRSDGAIGGLVVPGMHPMGAHGESDIQERPRIVHTMTFIGHVKEKPMVVGFDTF